jgi:hypothetical protein
MFLLQNFKVGFFLSVQTLIVVSCVILLVLCASLLRNTFVFPGLVHGRLQKRLFFGLQSNDGIILTHVDLFVLIILAALPILFLLYVRPVDSLSHSHQNFFTRRLDWVFSVVVTTSFRQIVMAGEKLSVLLRLELSQSSLDLILGPDLLLIPLYSKLLLPLLLDIEHLLFLLDSLHAFEFLDELFLLLLD